jgi:urease accessory protein
MAERDVIGCAGKILSRPPPGNPILRTRQKQISDSTPEPVVDSPAPAHKLTPMSIAPFESAHALDRRALPVRRFRTPAAIALLALAMPLTASAHTETSLVGGFLSGFTHPLTGLDHMVAMFAVGLWGAFLGQRAIWTLPVVFPVVMAVGGAAGVVGMPLPAVETGIALSAGLLGLLVAFAVKPPLWAAAAVVGFFAIFHGHAHGTELPKSANALAYAIGFVIATGLLHLAGIGVGMLARWPWGKIAIRVGGGAIAAVGFAFLFGFL